MNKTANSEATSEEPEKPVQPNDNDIKFPPFPEPSNHDFDEDVTEEEKEHYKTKFKDLNVVTTMRLHCTACDRHIGSSASKENIMRIHPMLRTLVCVTCYTFYNSGEFEKGDDGSELYCRWCGQGGQVYCCSNCPHVFCSRCVKRNLGIPKIKEIENTDDWKCFKCDSRCIWDLRALCWALLRYCDLKNKITEYTQDPELKDAYKKDCLIDYTLCCKNKMRRREKSESIKKKEKEAENSTKKPISPLNLISKFPPTIQVKKFASITPDDSPKEKKAQKRPASPRPSSIFIRTPIPLPSCSNVITPISMSSMAKKMRMTNPPPQNFVKYKTYSRIKSKQPQMHLPILPSNQFNGYNNTDSYGMVVNDNINLSLESLTQGLDMAAVAAMSNRQNQDDDVVCTPDFPLEPLCEVTEDNTDDDVQCITPGPVAAPKVDAPPPPPLTRVGTTIPDLKMDNIIQMTENDVTVNTTTGGLKFRVDPQTLSSNKMYRLPDGRIFAINVNPNMPGGYSATIVAVTESSANTKLSNAPKGATYSAKLSAVQSSETVPPPLKLLPNQNTRTSSSKRITNKVVKVSRSTETSSRECDLDVSVEWYRYNLIDAVDALEYSLSRLNKLKNETTPMYLRTRTVDEMRHVNRTLERLLNTSSRRFNEIRDNLQKGFKEYILKKSGYGNISDDDDDVEILNDVVEENDPIFIDENSMDSNANANESQDVVMNRHTRRCINHSYNHQKLVDKGYVITKIPIRNRKRNDTHKIENRNAFSSPVSDVNNLSDIYCKENMNDEDVLDNDKNLENDENEDIQKNGNHSNDNETSLIDDRKEEDTVLHGSFGNYDNKNTNGIVEQQDKLQEECNKNENIVTNIHDETNDKITQDKENDEVRDNDKKSRDNENEVLRDRENDEEVQDKDEENDEKIENEHSDKESDLKIKNKESGVKIKDKESDDKMQDSEISDEMIENLLKEDDGMDESDSTHNNSLDTVEVV